MTPDPTAAGGPPPSGESLELEHLALENRKLDAELRRMPSMRWERFQRIGPVFGGLITAAAFLFGVYQYVQQQDRALDASADALRKESAARDQEFMRPLWERELATYFHTSEVVATMATTPAGAARKAAEAEFWRLYVGPLVILETKPLSDAMVVFGHCFDGTEPCDDALLRHRALGVSTAIQQAVEEHASRRLTEFSRDKYQYRSEAAQPNGRR